MKAAVFALLALVALAPGSGHADQSKRLPPAALIAAAKRAPLRLIDALETYCDGETAIGAWLRRLTAHAVRRIAWSAGACELVNKINPIDAGGNQCVQARLILFSPKDRHDRPEIEIYLEDPKHGRPGAVYAFRAVFDGVDGADYIRFRKDFEAEWRQRFKDAAPAACSDDG